MEPWEKIHDVCDTRLWGEVRHKEPASVLFSGVVNSSQILYTIFQRSNLYTYILHNISSALAFHKNRQIGWERPNTGAGRESFCANYLPSSLSSSEVFKKSELPDFPIPWTLDPKSLSNLKGSYRPLSILTGFWKQVQKGPPEVIWSILPLLRKRSSLSASSVLLKFQPTICDFIDLGRNLFLSTPRHPSRFLKAVLKSLIYLFSSSHPTLPAILHGFCPPGA